LVLARLQVAGGEAIFESPTRELVGLYSAAGIEFAACPDPSEFLPCFEKAAAILARVPGIEDMIAALWRSTHLIHSAGPSYDASHSDPELPFSIFVSISPAECYAALRLAESILHECLHLQLTLIEREVPLVEDDSWTSFSPWQQRVRPLSGLLHGTYVFASIRAFWAEQLTAPLNDETSSYAKRRVEEIGEELDSLDACFGNEGLTPEGRRFALYLGKLIEQASR
jgi:HEXXH motif-containing protein